MLDKFRETAITWDKANRKVYEPLRVSAGDNKGRKLSVQVVDGGVVENLSGASLYLFWETKDKMHKGLDVFTAVDATKGEFEIYYTTGMLSNEGTLNANLVLVDTGGRVVSEPFTITVFKGIDDDAIQSSDSFTALAEALITVNQYDSRITNVEDTKVDKSIFEQSTNDLTAQLQHTATDLASNEHNLKYRGSVNAQDHGEYAKHKRGCVVITDDGFKKPLIDIVKPVLDQYGIKISIAKELNTFGEDVSGSMEQLKMMYREGHEIMSHSVNHPNFNSLTEEQIIYELRESKRILKENGMEPSNFVYPYNSAPYLAQKNVLKYYRSGMALEEKAPMAPPLRQEVLPRAGLGIYQEHTMAEIKSMCLDAKNNGKVFILMTHAGLIEGDITTVEQTTQPIIDIIKYCVANGIDMLTMDEALDRVGNIYQIGTQVEGGYEILAADKKIYTDMYASSVLKVDYSEILDVKSPSFYRKYVSNTSPKILLTVFGEATINNPNIPVAIPGTLMTEVTPSESNGYIRQEYRVIGNDTKFTRVATVTDTWTEWHRDATNLSYPATALPTNQPPSFFNQFISTNITRKIFYRFGVDDVANPNLPVANVGTLVVTKVSSSGILDKQEYTVSLTGEMYTRVGQSNDTWGAWKQTTGPNTGFTSKRPTGATTGFMYFDTTINKPIWKSGSVWVDATGATV